MHHVFISFPFWIKSDTLLKKEFFDYCKKKKIQVISRVRDQKMHAWKADDYYNVSVRFKDTAKFNLETDPEFYKFLDQTNVLFVRLTIFGKYDKAIEIYNYAGMGNFKCLTEKKTNVNHMTMLDLGWIVNQTCHFGVRDQDLYIPEQKE